MAKELFTLYLHNISGGRDCRGLDHPAVKPGKFVLDDYLELYQQQAPQPDILVLTEAHTDIPPEFDPGDGTATSAMIKVLSEGLELAHTAVHTHSASHLDQEKSLAGAVLSRFPINSSEALLLPNPHLKHEVYPGVIWESFDKKLQVANLQMAEESVEIATHHGVPFHRFGERLYTPGNPSKYADYRRRISRALLPREGMPRITAGDFNNYEVDIEDAFSELISGDNYAQAIRGVPTMPRYYPRTQFDHVLYQQRYFRVESTQVIDDTPSDHSLLIVQFSRRNRQKP
jgi:endonuclease/exonuclease/phosphatase family metal-dependent hydrolase